MLPVFKNCWIELQINLAPAAGFCRGSSVFLCLWKHTTVLHKYIPATAIKENIYRYKGSLEDSSEWQKTHRTLKLCNAKPILLV